MVLPSTNDPFADFTSKNFDKEVVVYFEVEVETTDNYMNYLASKVLMKAWPKLVFFLSRTFPP